MVNLDIVQNQRNNASGSEVAKNNISSEEIFFIKINRKKLLNDLNNNKIELKGYSNEEIAKKFLKDYFSQKIEENKIINEISEKGFIILSILENIEGKDIEEQEITKMLIEYNKEQEKFISVKKEISDIRNSDKNPSLIREEIINTIYEFILNNFSVKTIKEDVPVYEIFFYKNGIYEDIGRAEIKEIVKKILNKSYTGNIANRVIENIEVSTFVNKEEFFNSDIVNKDYICVKNGVLNIKTKKLLDFNSEYIFFNKLPIIFDPKAKCEEIENHLKEVLPEKNDRKTIKQLIGYCLYKDLPIQKGFIFSGSGSNGKSVTCSLIQKFLGKHNVSNISLEETQGENNFKLICLNKKLANINSDISNTALRKTGKIKELIGYDTIQCSRKFKSDISFKNYAKFIFSCNELPYICDNSDGFFRKWIIINFNQKFVKNITNLDDNQKKADLNIFEKITTQKELSGLLNIALDELQELLNEGDFSKSVSTEETRKVWELRSNSFIVFFEKHYEFMAESEIVKNDIRIKYYEFCRNKNVKPTQDRYIKSFLETKGIFDKRNSNNEFCWLNMVKKV
jgi:putative DNA primase/helicase